MRKALDWVLLLAEQLCRNTITQLGEEPNPKQINLLSYQCLKPLQKMTSFEKHIILFLQTRARYVNVNTG